MTMILCRKKGYVSLRYCSKCSVLSREDNRKILKGKMLYAHDPEKNVVSPGGCPYFVESVNTSLTTDSPFIPRKIAPFRL